jgi:hypothetical protein
MRWMTTQSLRWGTLVLALVWALPCAASQEVEQARPPRNELVPSLCGYSVDSLGLVLSQTVSSRLRYGAAAPLSYEPPQLDRAPVAQPASRGPAPATGASYRSPGSAGMLAWGFSVGSLALGGMFASEGRAEGVIAGYVAASLGLGIGASAGHFYAGEVGRGLLTAALRLVGFGFGGLMLISAWAGRASEYPRMSAGEAQTEAGMGLALIASSLGLAIYDMVDAPRAARRTNARYGLTNVSLAPLLTTRGPVPGRGAAVQARF